jgi:hypothetical protein
MRFIRRLAIALVTFAAIFAGVGLPLPGRVHVERSVAVAAQPGQILSQQVDPAISRLGAFLAIAAGVISARHCGNETLRDTQMGNKTTMKPPPYGHSRSRQNCPQRNDSGDER